MIMKDATPLNSPSAWGAIFSNINITFALLQEGVVDGGAGVARLGGAHVPCPVLLIVLVLRPPTHIILEVALHQLRRSCRTYTQQLYIKREQWCHICDLT